MALNGNDSERIVAIHATLQAFKDDTGRDIKELKRSMGQVVERTQALSTRLNTLETKHRMLHGDIGVPAVVDTGDSPTGVVKALGLPNTMTMKYLVTAASGGGLTSIGGVVFVLWLLHQMGWLILPSGP